jgi:hypothetical protein
MEETPNVNLNGTSGEDLLAGLLNARNLILEALSALNAIQPHPRDYSPDGFVLARKLHARQTAEMKKTADELYVMAQEVQDQIDGRTSIRR